MEAFLDACLPRLLPTHCLFVIHPFRGKQDLLRKIGRRLNGYARWLPPAHRIFLVVDRDKDECGELKARLEDACSRAGLRSRRTAGGSDWQIVTRLAIEELEAWYFGDWQAVRSAFPKVSPKIPYQSRYRDPDRIPNTAEAFERVLQRGTYFPQGLPKVQVAAAIGKHIDPARNQSHSFSVFRAAIAEAARPPTPRDPIP